MDIIKDIKEQLFSMQDKKYKEFSAKLIPNIDSEKVIGVRTPALRKYAKELYKTCDVSEFLKQLPHEYHEENLLHGFLIEQVKDYESCIYELERFLPYIDNWAVCDCMSPKVLKKHTGELLEHIYTWICSDKTYTVRYAIGMLMRYYLEEEYKTIYSDMVAKVTSDEYYINMMRAWYFATALAKQWDSIIAYIEEKRLDVWTHNKTIQKAVESFRITNEQKTVLRSMRVK